VADQTVMDNKIVTDASVFIYGLAAPGEQIRYVGQTMDLGRRHWAHLNEAKAGKTKTYKNRWVKGLLDQGIEPTIRVLNDVPKWAANDEERWWISFFRDLGYPLVNGTDGGELMHTPEGWAALKAAKANSTYVHSSETKQRMSEAHKTRYADPAERERARRMALRNGNKPPVHLGGDNSQAKLTDDEVFEIRVLHKSGSTMNELADVYGVTKTNIWFILVGKSRKEAGGPLVVSKGKFKLTEDDVREIRRLITSGTSDEELAQRFNVSRHAIIDIRLRRRWKSVP
jgi:hypothetical protein